MSRVYLALTIFWLLALIPTLIWWRDSVLWVALMSIYANVMTSASAYQGSRAEKAVKDNNDRASTS